MRFVVVDCETSGLSAVKNKVLTVGLLHAEITKHRLRLLDEHHIQVKHTQYNPSGLALKINKINLDEHHKVAIRPNKACASLQEFLRKNDAFTLPVLGHNLGFDYRFLDALHKQGKSKFLLSHDRVDTMVLWRDLMARSIIPQGRASLKHVSKALGVSYAGAHDALADCKITAEVYHNILKL